MLSQRIYRIRSQLIGSAGLHSLALPAPCQHSELREAFKRAVLLPPPRQRGPGPALPFPALRGGGGEPRSRGLAAACFHWRLLRARSHGARGCFCARVFIQRQGSDRFAGSRGELPFPGEGGTVSSPLRAFGRPVPRCSLPRLAPCFYLTEWNKSLHFLPSPAPPLFSSVTPRPRRENEG